MRISPIVAGMWLNLRSALSAVSTAVVCVLGPVACAQHGPGAARARYGQARVVRASKAARGGRTQLATKARAHKRASMLLSVHEHLSGAHRA